MFAGFCVAGCANPLEGFMCDPPAAKKVAYSMQLIEHPGGTCNLLIDTNSATEQAWTGIAVTYPKGCSSTEEMDSLKCGVTVHTKCQDWEYEETIQWSKSWDYANGTITYRSNGCETVYDVQLFHP